MNEREKLVVMLTVQEGKRKHPYRDTVGKLTIGIGRNLDDVGLSDDEIHYLLDNDLNRAEAAARKYSWFPTLDWPRQLVIVNMILNLGATRFAGFHRMIRALEIDDYSAATSEMIDSDWHDEVKGRALTLEKIMREGKWP